ncbi:cupin domain-containing protein [Aestuariivirga sp.]|uniref:cupin domain-containing protein n=1 Tax=Aestuariivirga sp. TaxID=2650926 RepID=UPI003BACE4A5
MPVVSFGKSEIVKAGYFLQTPMDLALTDNAGAPVEFCKFSLQSNASTMDDEHEEHEIWFIISGSGELDLGGEMFAVSAGATIYIEPCCRHRLFNTGPEDMNVISVYWGADA